MVKCSRCKHAFDETARSTCPLCFTPVSADSERIETSQVESGAPLVGAAVPAAVPPSLAPTPASPTMMSAPPAPSLNGMTPETMLPSSPAEPAPMPVSQVASPLPPAAALGSNMRVSPLTGEMIAGSATEAQPSLAAGMSAPKPKASNALPAVRSATSGDRTSGIVRDHGPAPELAVARSNRLKEMVAVAIILLVAGVAGYTYYTHLPTPKTAALAYYKSVVKADWKTVYEQTLFSDDEKTKFPDSDTFTKQADASLNNPIVQAVMAQLKQSANTITVGEPKIDGDKAEVPTSAKLTFNGQTVTLGGTAHMINKDGWKFNAATGVTQSIGDMLGRPSAGGSAGN